MTPKNPLWEIGRKNSGFFPEAPKGWPRFESERELIAHECKGVQTAVLKRLYDWDNLHAFLTGSSSRSLAALWFDASVFADMTAVCRTLGSPDLRLQTVLFSPEELTDKEATVLAAFLRSRTDEKARLRNIGMCFHHLSAFGAERILEAFQGSDCQLQGLGLYAFDIRDKAVIGFAKALREGKCNLRHLSLYSYALSEEARGALFQALSSNGCKLSELRTLSFGASADVKAAVTSLTEVLRDASCQLQRLAITLEGEHADEQMSILAQAFQSEDCKLIEFELFVRGRLTKTTTAYIAGVLRSSHCRLEALRLLTNGVSNPELLVDALQRNLRLTSLYTYPDLPDALRVRCEALLQRNQRLRDGELLERPHAKAHMAKLFICGHQQVGKTTVRKGLRRAKRSFVTINLRDLVVEEPRTRGMEFEQLSFATGSLVVCDLAGHKEYHTFHHYFVSGSDKDLFLIVCTSQHAFESHLQYWLRFILSHRTPGMSQPKVIVLVNYFHSTLGKVSLSEDATGKTRQFDARYQDDLDFGGMPATNIFGINATKVGHLTPILGKLEALLGELLDSRPRIPRLCYDISSIIPRSLSWQSVVSREDSHYLSVGHIVHKYSKRFCGDGSPFPPLKAFSAALVELHNSGQIIYFQPNDESKLEEEIVIADCNWFCRNLIGALLEPKELRIRNRNDMPWIWRKEDVLKILRQHQPRAHEQELNEVLRYLQCLELVYPIYQGNMNHISLESELLFPALLSDTKEVISRQLNITSIH